LDFTIKTYHKLLEALIAQGYAFQTFAGFLEAPEPKSIILRHDVDLRPGYSLRFARIQHEAGVKGSYYFRMVPQSFDETIIKEIASLGHEIGYHYETMDLVSSKFKVQSAKGVGHGAKGAESELIDAAMELFMEHLEKFRKIAPVKTVCMHGSPLSRYDNRDLWKQYNYKDFGILGEPYFDVDFAQVLYLTDTGRRWDGEKVSVRDKVVSQQNKFQIPNSIRQLADQTNPKSKITQKLKTLTQNSRLKTQNFKFHSTFDIINASPLLPDQIMFTFHPQRWTDDPLPWLKELVMQNVKNVVKTIMLSRRRA
jgi:hypothetical protein